MQFLIDKHRVALMQIKKGSLIYKTVSLILIVAFVCPIGVDAVEPRASDYLDSYNAYPYSAGWGKIQIWFTVTADNYMADIGSLRIAIYESTDGSTWSPVKTFINNTTPSMLGHNEIFYQSHVEYQGAIGRYYKAYVCIYAGDGTNGDTRYFWTNSQKATLFAQST